MKNKMIKKLLVHICYLFLIANHALGSATLPSLATPTDPFIDKDLDGLSNTEEIIRGTNPNNPDTDGDGKNDSVDGWPRDSALSPTLLPDVQYAIHPLKLLIPATGYQVETITNSGNLILNISDGPAFAYRNFPIYKYSFSTRQLTNIAPAQGELTGWAYSSTQNWTNWTNNFRQISESTRCKNITYQLTDPFYFPLILPPFKSQSFKYNESLGLIGSFYSSGNYSAGIISNSAVENLLPNSTDLTSPSFDYRIHTSTATAIGDDGSIATVETEYSFSGSLASAQTGSWKIQTASYIKNFSGESKRIGNVASRSQNGDQSIETTGSFFYPLQVGCGSLATGTIGTPSSNGVFSQSTNNKAISINETVYKVTDLLPTATYLQPYIISNPDSLTDDAALVSTGAYGGNYWLIKSNGANYAWTKLKTWDPDQQIDTTPVYLMGNRRFELCGFDRTGPCIVRNGIRWFFRQLAQPSWNVTISTMINAEGIILADAKHAFDTLGQLIDPAQQQTEQVLLVPIEVTWETIENGAEVGWNRAPVDCTMYGMSLKKGAPLLGGGFRVLPGAATGDDTQTHDQVLLKVKLPTSFAGRTVEMAIFDVDDPVPYSFDTSYVAEARNLHLDPDDTPLISIGNDNHGDFVDNNLTGGYFPLTNSKRAQVVVTPQGIATIAVRVGMQPGDNYRVAITLGAATELDSLQVQGSDLPGYVPTAGRATLSNFSGVLSPLLTVWRRLHIEQDSMAEVSTTGGERNLVQGRVRGISLLSSDQTPHTYQVTIDDDNDNSIHNDSLNRFDEGKIILDGVPFKVKSSNQETPVRLIVYENAVEDLSRLLNTSQVINGYLNLEGEDIIYQLIDDDSTAIPTEFTLPLPDTVDFITDAVRSKYVPAYIELDTTKPNPVRLLTFIRNASTAPYHPYGRNLNDRADFWAARLVSAFQPPIGEDGDPHSTLDGGTKESPTSGEAGEYVVNNTGIGSIDAFIYMESFREFSRILLNNQVNYNQGVRDMREQRDIVVAHELGHMPPRVWTPVNDDHIEGGLMSSYEYVNSTSEFTAITLRRIRNTLQWTH
jgi:hypothetical protein